MTRSTSTRRTVRKTRTKTELSPRAVLLAGLGAFSLGRKQALKSADGLASGTEALCSRAEAAAREAAGRVAKFRKQAKARLAPVQKQAAQFARKAQAEFEARFAPVLAQLEGKTPTKRTSRTAKRTTRPAAKRTRKRA
jgi:hypothetical protein